MRNDARAASPAVRREQNAHARVTRRYLGVCPGCGARAHSDARTVRYKDDWYHVRCALEHLAIGGQPLRAERARS